MSKESLLIFEGCLTCFKYLSMGAVLLAIFNIVLSIADDDIEKRIHGLALLIVSVLVMGISSVAANSSNIFEQGIQNAEELLTEIKTEDNIQETDAGLIVTTDNELLTDSSENNSNYLGIIVVIACVVAVNTIAAIINAVCESSPSEKTLYGELVEALDNCSNVDDNRNEKIDYNKRNLSFFEYADEISKLNRNINNVEITKNLNYIVNKIENLKTLAEKGAKCDVTRFERYYFPELCKALSFCESYEDNYSNKSIKEAFDEIYETSNSILEGLESLEEYALQKASFVPTSDASAIRTMLKADGLI